MVLKEKLVGFGELLLRLDSPGYARLTQSDSLVARYTGGEANVLVAACHCGVQQSHIVSRVPDHAIGDACINQLRQQGLKTDSVLRGGERLGILFVENGVSLRPTRVIYDRKYSSFSDLSPKEFEWEQILDHAFGLHITGTAAAVSTPAREALMEAMSVAKSQGCKVSFDLGYRSSLWTPEVAADTYKKVLPHVDLLFASPQDASLFFGIEDDHEQRQIERLRNQFELSEVAFTRRIEASASRNSLQGVLYSNEGCYESSCYEFEVVDRIGSGDAFAGALLASQIKSQSAGYAIEFATAAAVLKHTIPGDFCTFGAEEIDDLVSGKGIRIRR